LQVISFFIVNGKKTIYLERNNTAYFNRVTCPPPWRRRTFSALNLMVFTTELKLLIIKIYSFFFLLSPIILIKHSELNYGNPEAARRDR